MPREQPRHEPDSTHIKLADHCKRGHILCTENIYWRKNKQGTYFSDCRICRHMRVRNWWRGKSKFTRMEDAEAEPTKRWPETVLFEQGFWASAMRRLALMSVGSIIKVEFKCINSNIHSTIWRAASESAKIGITIHINNTHIYIRRTR